MMGMAVFLLAACSSGAKKDVLRVGMELAYPPFETKGDDGNPMGVSVDIAKAFGEYLGKEVVIENIAWSGLIPSLQTDKVDMVISSMTITAERSQIIDFSDPYAKSHLAMLVGEKSPVTSVETLNQEGRIVALKQGTTSHIYAQNYLSNVTIHTFSSEVAAMTEVIQGKADAFMYDQLTIYRNNLDNPGTKMFPLPSTEETVGDWGAAFKKGNTELKDQFNEFLKKFRSEGGFEEITEKYLKEEKEVFDRNGFDFFF
ncbi:MAG: transporter substrate-binding domain-containing protein [Brevinema sp.]